MARGGQETNTLKVGDRAPDFDWQSHLDTTVKLSDLWGKNVLLAFYPYDWSPVCATEMPSYEARTVAFAALNTQVLGISVDSTWSHQAWAKQIKVSYPMLSDYFPHGKVTEAYGILRADAAERATFIIDPLGTVRWIDVQPILELPDVDEILKVLATNSQVND